MTSRTHSILSQTQAVRSQHLKTFRRFYVKFFITGNMWKPLPVRIQLSFRLYFLGYNLCPADIFERKPELPGDENGRWCYYRLTFVLFLGGHFEFYIPSHLLGTNHLVRGLRTKTCQVQLEDIQRIPLEKRTFYTLKDQSTVSPLISIRSYRE